MSGSDGRTRITRRGFIKKAAIAGAGAAALSLTDWNKAEAAKAPEKWDNTADVIIIGTGFAGLCAAVEAADAGAKVLVLDKEDHIGGNSVLSGGQALFTGTNIQRKFNIEDRPEWMFEDMMKWGDNRAVPEILWTFIKNGADTVLWMEKIGFKWADTIVKTPDSRVPRAHWPAPVPGYQGGWPKWGGNITVAALKKAADQRKVPILLNHKMTKVLRPDPAGPVIGVEVDAGGKTLNFKANRAVIIATGGFKGNVQMRQAWDPRLTGDLDVSGLPYVHTTGEGTLLAVDAGAGLTDMSFVCEFLIVWGNKQLQVWEPRNQLTSAPIQTGLPVPDYKRIMIVKNDAKRFLNETKSAVGLYATDYFIQNVVDMKERPRIVWAVTDSEGARVLGWKPDMFQNPDPFKPPFIIKEYVATADNIRDLAAKANLSPDNLEATLNRYNSYVGTGDDKEVGKPGPVNKIAKPPFYIARLGMFAHNQRGGIRTNTRAQVLERAEQLTGKGVPIDQEKTIPHLYAAGECVGGYFGTKRGPGKISVYMVYGRIAGKNAAAEKPV